MVTLSDEMYDLAQILWPMNRSLTGQGVKDTLLEVSNYLPNLKRKRIKSGAKVFDWIIPEEWEILDAYIITPDGEKICDFQKNNLHILGYSDSYSGVVPLEILDKHLFSLPNQPDAIPYVTSYYENRWGFCIDHNTRKKLKSGNYRVEINSRKVIGTLEYAELYIPGKTKKEILISTYVCHPSMANNEISGIVVTTFLARWLSGMKNLNYSYRFVFVPETIGSIAFISRNIKKLKKNVVAGFNVTCVGDDRQYSYLPSRSGNSLSDYVARHVLKHIDKSYVTYSWLDRGSDERQYCAPGIDLPIASIMRTKYGEYPEYHTSLDRLGTVVSKEGLLGGFSAIQKALTVLEQNCFPKVSVLCEPQLSKKNLYPTISIKDYNGDVRLMLNVISYCDGDHSLLDIAEICSIPFDQVYEIFQTLLTNGLIHISPT